jgi:hypothetical protein
MKDNPRRVRRALTTGAIVVGASIGAAGIASAATSSGSSSTSTSTSTPSGSSSSGSAAGAPSGTPPAGTDPATLNHGPNETLLTGTDLQKATAAATAAEPGATVIRAETDSSGASPYEVHMKKSDGTDVTVELDSSFNVVTTVSGFGGGPAGSSAPTGAPPASSSTSA